MDGRRAQRRTGYLSHSFAYGSTFYQARLIRDNISNKSYSDSDSDGDGESNMIGKNYLIMIIQINNKDDYMKTAMSSSAMMLRNRR